MNHISKAAARVVGGSSMLLGGAFMLAALASCNGADDTVRRPKMPTVDTAPDEPATPPPVRDDAVVQISADSSSCAVRRDGKLLCWGIPWSESVFATARTRPTPFSLPGPAVAVDSRGLFFACVALADGTAHCWGANTYGQLGHDRFTSEQTESPSRIPEIRDAVDIAVGQFFACALHRSGRVSCWGRNDEGQLGFEPADHGHPVPRAVEGIDRAVALAAGYSHACVLEEAGEVRCWGGNGMPRVLGSGDSSERPPIGRPVAVEGLTDVAAIGAGGTGTCAVRRNGNVICWGPGDAVFSETSIECDRYLIAPPELNCRHPGPRQIPEVADAVRVATDGTYACAALKSGTIRCWGANQYRQLGRDTTADHEKQSVFAPGDVDGVTTAIDVAVGSQSACAVLADGRAVCWGNNTMGQIGDGTRGPGGSLAKRPTPPTPVLGL